MAAEWTYLLGDLATGAVTAEVELSSVRISKRLNGAGTMTGTWNLSAAAASDNPSVLTTPARTMGVAFRNGIPIWGGILWARRWSSDSPNLDLGFSDWWSFLDHRYVLPALVPDGTTSQISALTTTFAQVEQNEIARQLVAQAQAHTGGNIGIVCDTVNSGILRDRTYAGHELVDVATALEQLAGVIDGPDLMFDVSPELDVNGRVVKRLRIGDPKLGQQGSSHVFEYGGNIQSYRWESDGTRMATRTFATGEGMAAGQLIAVAEDDTRYGDGWVLLESQAQYNTVSQDSTLQEHADADLVRARLPVVTPSLTVRGDAIPAIGEYQPGDQVRVIIRDEFFRGAGLDTEMRIVGLDLDPGDNGPEQATLTMNSVFDDIA